jgi:hypothetical protein
LSLRCIYFVSSTVLYCLEVHISELMTGRRHTRRRPSSTSRQHTCVCLPLAPHTCIFSYQPLSTNKYTYLSPCNPSWTKISGLCREKPYENMTARSRAWLLPRLTSPSRHCDEFQSTGIHRPYHCYTKIDSGLMRDAELSIGNAWLILFLYQYLRCYVSLLYRRECCIFSHCALKVFSNLPDRERCLSAELHIKQLKLPI